MISRDRVRLQEIDDVGIGRRKLETYHIRRIYSSAVKVEGVIYGPPGPEGYPRRGTRPGIVPIVGKDLGAVVVFGIEGRPLRGLPYLITWNKEVRSSGCQSEVIDLISGPIRRYRIGP